MATRARKTEPEPAEAGLLQAILQELQALNRRVDDIAALLARQAEGNMDPGRAIDPGDSVPEGVAPLDPAPLTPEDKKVRRALERLPRGRSSGEKRK